MTGKFSRTAAAAVLGCLALLAPAAQAAAEWRGPEVAGRLPADTKEASGLAVSRHDRRMFWTHDDSGGEPALRAIGADGAPRGTLRIAGVNNVDWEDLVSFTLDGRHWLLVADTGDNRSMRTDCALYVIEEPAPEKLRPGTECVADVAWRLPVIYPDGPRDCEAVAVDAGEGRVYLLAKRVTPHGLYVLPLRPAASGQAVPVAQRVGELPAFPPAPEAERMLPTARGMFRPQPTGMDFSSDGFAAVIVTYGDVLVYSRGYDELWATALMREPRRLAEHGLRQAEAVAFGADSSEILVTSEGAGAPLLCFRRARK